MALLLFRYKIFNKAITPINAPAMEYENIGLTSNTTVVDLIILNTTHK